SKVKDLYHLRKPLLNAYCILDWSTKRPKLKKKKNDFPKQKQFLLSLLKKIPPEKEMAKSLPLSLKATMMRYGKIFCSTCQGCRSPTPPSFCHTRRPMVLAEPPPL
ncbi:hypothetical protein LINGRAHAP2_LOCUS37066, partial [Linum grandiflorum]